MKNYRPIKNTVANVESKIGSNAINSGIKRIIYHNQVGFILERKVHLTLKFNQYKSPY